MDAKEVEARGRAIQKSMKDNDSSSITALLDELSKKVKASEDLLRSTKIGIIVNKLKGYNNSAVAQKAGELVGKWRQDVRKAGGSSTPRTVNGTASPAPGASTPVPPRPKAQKHTVPPEQRNSKTDNVNTEVPNSKIRSNCLKLIYDGLAHMSEEMPENVLGVARDVELAAYNKYQPDTSSAYKDKIRSLYQNLKNKSNPQLRRRVLSGDIIPERFVVMTHEELKSHERRLEDERLQKENMRTALAPQEKKAISDSLQCGKCGQRKVAYSQAQTRSADEPMTTFCQCMACGKKWKFS